MKKISIIAAALALGIPATAYAAADCCKGMEGKSCCADKAKDSAESHAGHHRH